MRDAAGGARGRCYGGGGSSGVDAYLGTLHSMVDQASQGCVSRQGDNGIDGDGRWPKVGCGLDGAGREVVTKKYQFENENEK